MTTALSSRSNVHGSLISNRKTNCEVGWKATKDYFCVLNKKDDTKDYDPETAGTAVNGAAFFGCIVGGIPGLLCWSAASSVKWCCNLGKTLLIDRECDLPDCGISLWNSTATFAQAGLYTVGFFPAAVGAVVATVVTCPCCIYTVSNAIERNNWQNEAPPRQTMDN